MCAKLFVQCIMDALSWVLYDGSLSTGRASGLSDPLIGELQAFCQVR